jgi:hypothetical protein
MTLLQNILLYALHAITFGVLCFAMGANKKMGQYTAAALGFFLGVIGLIIVSCSRRKTPEQKKHDLVVIQLAKFKNMMKHGIITQNDFELMKKYLLNK